MFYYGTSLNVGVSSLVDTYDFRAWYGNALSSAYSERMFSIREHGRGLRSSDRRRCSQTNRACLNIWLQVSVTLSGIFAHDGAEFKLVHKMERRLLGLKGGLPTFSNLGRVYFWTILEIFLLYYLLLSSSIICLLFVCLCKITFQQRGYYNPESNRMISFRRFICCCRLTSRFPPSPLSPQKCHILFCLSQQNWGVAGPTMRPYVRCVKDSVCCCQHCHSQRLCNRTPARSLAGRALVSQGANSIWISNLQ